MRICMCLKTIIFDIVVTKGDQELLRFFIIILVVKL